MWLAQAFLRKANLREANLREAILFVANIRRAILRRADLSGADLRRAILNGAALSGADLRDVKNIEHCRSLEKTNLQGVKGLTREHLKACEAMGAIIDENRATNLFQSNVSPALSPQNNNVQTPPNQVNALSSGPENKRPSSQSDPE